MYTFSKKKESTFWRELKILNPWQFIQWPVSFCQLLKNLILMEMLTLLSEGIFLALFALNYQQLGWITKILVLMLMLLSGGSLGLKSSSTPEKNSLHDWVEGIDVEECQNLNQLLMLKEQLEGTRKKIICTDYSKLFQAFFGQPAWI